MSINHYLIDQPLSEFLESEVAILIASSDNTNKPCISRGFGVRVSDDCTKVTVFMTEKQSKIILNNVKITGRIVLNAARVTNYESYQLKGVDALSCVLSLKDERHVLQYVKEAQGEMMKVGVTSAQAAAIFQSQDNENLIGIKFTVTEVYCQTPGPGAGNPREQV